MNASGTWYIKLRGSKINKGNNIQYIQYLYTKYYYHYLKILRQYHKFVLEDLRDITFQRDI